MTRRAIRLFSLTVALTASSAALGAAAASADLRSYGANSCASGTQCFAAAVDSTGKTYVVDHRWRRVYVLSAQGALTRTLDGSNGAQTFVNPQQVVVDSADNVYVADDSGPIQEFDGAGNYVRSFSNGGARSVTVDGQGNVYQVDGGGMAVTKFNPDGSWAGSWAPSCCGLVNMAGIAYSPADGRLYVANTWGRIYKLDGLSQVGAWGQTGPDPGDFPDGLSGVAVDPDGDVYVSVYNGLIQKFTRDGAYLSQSTLGQSGHLFIRGTTLMVGRGTDAAAVDLDRPVAHVSANPATPRVGDTITLSAAGSFMPFGSISTYEWDLDGNGTFDQSTGTNPTVTTAYTRTGTHTISVRVSGGTATSTSSITLDVQPSAPVSTPAPSDTGGAPVGARPPVPPYGRVGVSINGGALFTNDPVVTVDLVWPLGARNALLSNDGGFRSVSSLPLSASVRWHLPTTGLERLPKTIYVRFDTTGSQTLTDDIILDETAPTVQSATLSGIGGGARAAAVNARTYTVRLKASDRTSGVKSVQVTADKHRPGRALTYKRAVHLKSATAPRWVRVLDRAGNPSKWRRLRKH
jgi:sugar lactone lactonase YvrE